MWITELIRIWKNYALNCACKCNHPKICWNLLLLSSLCKFYRCFENVIVSETSDIYAIYDLCRTLPSRRMFSRYLTARKTNVVKVCSWIINFKLFKGTVTNSIFKSSKSSIDFLKWRLIRFLSDLMKNWKCLRRWFF